MAGLRERAEVLELLPDNRVRLRIRRGTACEGCPARSLCASTGSGDHIITLRAIPGLQVGQTVELVLPEYSTTLLSLLLYGVPLLFLLAGLLIAGTALKYILDSTSQLPYLLGALLGLLSATLVLRYLDRRLGRHPAFLPTIADKTTRDSAETPS